MIFIWIEGKEFLPCAVVGMRHHDRHRIEETEWLGRGIFQETCTILGGAI